MNGQVYLLKYVGGECCTPFDVDVTPVLNSNEADSSVFFFSSVFLPALKLVYFSWNYLYTDSKSNEFESFFCCCWGSRGDY